MFDARYHALTVLGVLVALVLGLLLGTAIGDAGLVSSAERSLRDSLREDVRTAERRRGELESRLDQRDEFEQRAFPLLVKGRLAGRRIALVTLGRADDDVTSPVRTAVQTAGGELSPVLAIREPPDLEGLADAAQGTRFADLARRPDRIEDYGERVGRQLAAGQGALLEATAGPLLRTRDGDLRTVGGVALARSPEASDESAMRRARTLLERGIATGLAASGVPVVGVQPESATDAGLAWFSDRDLSAVDQVDGVQGQAALVLLLAGGARGTYGPGPTADGVLPQDTG